jgi:hypothetical protein
LSMFYGEYSIFYHFWSTDAKTRKHRCICHPDDNLDDAAAVGTAA